MSKLKIQDYLSYDPTSKTGLRWIQDRGKKVKAGDEAFTRIDNNNYYGGQFNYKTYTAHQVIMFLQYGQWSNINKQIDHIDGNKLNNNINNLRFVTPTGNQRNANRKINSNNTSGIPGLSLWSSKGYTYWKAKYAGMVKISKNKQVCIDWLIETKQNDKQYIPS